MSTNKLSDKEFDNMFHERPRAGQVVTILASQSEIMEDEKNLREKIIALTQSDIKIERPIKWHGYHIAVDQLNITTKDSIDLASINFFAISRGAKNVKKNGSLKFWQQQAMFGTNPAQHHQNK